MAKSKQQKNEALKLHKRGVATSKIAAKLKISPRTIQRWLKDETLVSVEAVGIIANRDASPSTPKDVEKRRDEFDTEFSRKMTAQLRSLTESALNTLEEIFEDPDARRSDKLGAAKLVADWVGLKAQPRYYEANAFISVPHRIEQAFAVPAPETKPSLAASDTDDPISRSDVTRLLNQHSEKT